VAEGTYTGTLIYCILSSCVSTIHGPEQSNGRDEWQYAVPEAPKVDPPPERLNPGTEGVAAVMGDGGTDGIM